GENGPDGLRRRHLPGQVALELPVSPNRVLPPQQGSYQSRAVMTPPLRSPRAPEPCPVRPTDDLDAGRPPLPRPPPSPGAATFAAGRARERHAGHRSARVSPVRSTRGRRPEPRPRPPRAARRLPAGGAPPA